MSYSVKIDLPDAVLGDAYPPSPDGSGKIIVSPILIDGVQPAVALARVEMRFRKSGLLRSVDSDSGITILDEDTWALEIPEFGEVFTSSGVWSWDMAFYPVGSTASITLYYGTITVSPDI